jgi:hypothetical protein
MLFAVVCFLNRFTSSKFRYLPYVTAILLNCFRLPLTVSIISYPKGLHKYEVDSQIEEERTEFSGKDLLAARTKERWATKVDQSEDGVLHPSLNVFQNRFYIREMSNY